MLVVSYGRGMKLLTEVAKTLEVPVVELQHGVINPHHLGYHYPETYPMRTFPKYVLSGATSGRRMLDSRYRTSGSSQ